MISTPAKSYTKSPVSVTSKLADAPAPEPVRKLEDTLANLPLEETKEPPKPMTET